MAYLQAHGAGGACVGRISLVSPLSRDGTKTLDAMRRYSNGMGAVGAICRPAWALRQSMWIRLRTPLVAVLLAASHVPVPVPSQSYAWQDITCSRAPLWPLPETHLWRLRPNRPGGPRGRRSVLAPRAHAPVPDVSPPAGRRRRGRPEASASNSANSDAATISARAVSCRCRYSLSARW